MLRFGVTIPATVPQRSEIPEGLMNYPVKCLSLHGDSKVGVKDVTKRSQYSQSLSLSMNNKRYSDIKNRELPIISGIAHR
jgi:hypothetical protein